jgi:hypothetical protein
MMLTVLIGGSVDAMSLLPSITRTRSGVSDRAGWVAGTALAVALHRLGRTMPLAEAASRISLTVVARELERREAQRRAIRLRWIRRSVLAGALVAATAAGTGRALSGVSR